MTNYLIRESKEGERRGKRKKSAANKGGTKKAEAVFRSIATGVKVGGNASRWEKFVRIEPPLPLCKPWGMRSNDERCFYGRVLRACASWNVHRPTSWNTNRLTDPFNPWSFASPLSPGIAFPSCFPLIIPVKMVKLARHGSKVEIL